MEADIPDMPEWFTGIIVVLFYGGLVGGAFALGWLF